MDRCQKNSLKLMVKDSGDEHYVANKIADGAVPLGC